MVDFPPCFISGVEGGGGGRGRGAAGGQLL